MKKKVLITTDHPAPYFNKLLDILDQDYDTSIIFHKRKDEYKSWKGLVDRACKFYDELNLFTYWKEYRRNDIAIIGGWMNKYCFITILLSFLFRTKCGVFSDHPMPDIRKNWFYYVKKYILFKRLDYLYCATESTCQFYHENYGVPFSKLKFFPYTFDDTFSEENVSINKQRYDDLEKPDAKIRIFIANNFIERKGYDVIVTAFENLNKQNILSRYKITIAGNGELYASVKESLDALNADITFLGWIEPKQYTDFMNNCDVYIHASTFEPFGIPPLDALCRQKVLVASKGVESVSAMIEHGVDGYLFAPKDGNQLTEILSHMDKHKFKTIGEAGRMKVKDTYNSEVYRKSIDSVFL